MPVLMSSILRPQKPTPRKLGRKYQSIKSMFIVQLHYMAIHHFICLLLVLKIFKPFKRISFRVSFKKLKKLVKFKLLLIQTWNDHQYEYSGHPRLILTIVFGTQFIYTWVKSQLYRLGPKLYMVPLKSPMFPCVFLFISHSLVFPTPFEFTLLYLL